MNQYFFKVPFATAGDVITIPQPIDGAGAVTFTQGYGPYYEQDPAVFPATARPVDRSSMNWLFNSITGALNQYQTFGTPEFITATDNGGSAFSYSKNARVRYRVTSGDPWHVYTSRIDSNTDLPTVSASWYREDAFVTVDMLNQSSTIAVPATTSTVTLTAAQNASSLLVFTGTINVGEAITVVLSDNTQIVEVDTSAVIFGAFSGVHFQTVSGGVPGQFNIYSPSKYLFEKNISGVYDFLPAYPRMDISKVLLGTVATAPATQANCTVTAYTLCTYSGIDNRLQYSWQYGVAPAAPGPCSFRVSFTNLNLTSALTVCGIVQGNLTTIQGLGVTWINTTTVQVNFNATSTAAAVLTVLYNLLTL